MGANLWRLVHCAVFAVNAPFVIVGVLIGLIVTFLARVQEWAERKEASALAAKEPT